VATAIVFFQAAILLLAGVFVLIVALIGSGNSIPFAGQTLSGGAAMVLGALYVGLTIAATYIGIALRRLVSWARNACVGLEAAMIVLFMAHGDLSVNLVINLLLCLAVVGLLVAPSVTAALKAAGAASQSEAAANTRNG
jgi:hypothetical protein